MTCNHVGFHFAGGINMSQRIWFDEEKRITEPQHERGEVEEEQEKLRPWLKGKKRGWGRKLKGNRRNMPGIESERAREWKGKMRTSKTDDLLPPLAGCVHTSLRPPHSYATCWRFKVSLSLNAIIFLSPQTRPMQRSCFVSSCGRGGSLDDKVGNSWLEIACNYFSSTRELQLTVILIFIHVLIFFSWLIINGWVVWVRNKQDI